MSHFGAALSLAGAAALAVACSVSDASSTSDAMSPGGKADDPGAGTLCPTDVALNAAEGSAKRCFDASNGRFVATECCAELCAGAGTRTQSNGDRCAWVDEPGLPGAQQGQFAPTVCCDLNDALACGRGEGTRGDCQDPATGRDVADVCCEPVAGECHPAVSNAILSCVYEMASGAREGGEPVPNLAALHDSCTEELETLAGELDQRCAFSPDLPFCGLPFEEIASDFIQPCAQAEQDAYECSLGLTFGNTTRQSHLAVVADDTFTASDAAGLDTLLQAQIVAAVSRNVGVSLTLAAAFDNVDQGLVNVLELFDLSRNASYTAVEFGAGDNSYGVFFASGTTEFVAFINDGDIANPDGSGLGCRAPIGAGGTLCSSNDNCAPGFQCTGSVASEDAIFSPIGLCIDTSFDPGHNDECTELFGCGSQGYCTGLVGGDSGFCGARWMFGRRDNEATIEVTDGGAARSDVLVYGQASVPMDLEVTLQLFHDTDVGELEVTLIIPGPDDGDDADRARAVIWPAPGLSTSHPTGGPVTIAVRNFGDETINGPWTLQVTDTVTNGAAGGVFGWSLGYSSRFD